MLEPTTFGSDRIVFHIDRSLSVALYQAPASTTASVAMLDLICLGYWPGLSVEGDMLTIQALNGRWRYRIEGTGREYAWDERRVLTLIEGAVLIPSPQGAAQGGDATAAAGGGDDGQGATGRDAGARSEGAQPQSPPPSPAHRTEQC